MRPNKTEGMESTASNRDARRGDCDALETLVVECRERPWTFARSRVRPELRDRLRADALTRETFARIDKNARCSTWSPEGRFVALGGSG